MTKMGSTPVRAAAFFPRNTAKPRAFPDKFLTKNYRRETGRIERLAPASERDSDLIVTARDSTTPNPLASGGTYPTEARTAEAKAEQIAAFLMV